MILFVGALAVFLAHTWWEVPNGVRVSPPEGTAFAYRSFLGETLVTTGNDLYIVSARGDEVRSPNDSSFCFLGGLALSTAMRPPGVGLFKAEQHVVGRENGTFVFTVAHGITFRVHVD